MSWDCLSLGSGIALHPAVRHPQKVASPFLASAHVTPPVLREILADRAMLHLWNQCRFWISPARHFVYQGARFGTLAYEKFRLECVAGIYSVPSATAVLLTAEAHKDNLPAQRWLLDRGWQCTGPANTD